MRLFRTHGLISNIFPVDINNPLEKPDVYYRLSCAPTSDPLKMSNIVHFSRGIANWKNVLRIGQIGVNMDTQLANTEKMQERIFTNGVNQTNTTPLVRCIFETVT